VEGVEVTYLEFGKLFDTVGCVVVLNPSVVGLQNVADCQTEWRLCIFV